MSFILSLVRGCFEVCGNHNVIIEIYGAYKQQENRG